VVYVWWMELGARMKQARLHAGKTQQQIADALKKTKAAVSNFEHDNNKPSIETLIAFAKETNVSLDWLLLGVQPGGEYDARIRALPDALREYVMMALLLSERVQMSSPVRFMRSPTTANYAEFSAYLTKLAADMAET